MVNNFQTFKAGRVNLSVVLNTDYCQTFKILLHLKIIIIEFLNRKIGIWCGLGLTIVVTVESVTALTKTHLFCFLNLLKHWCLIF